MSRPISRSVPDIRGRLVVGAVNRLHRRLTCSFIVWCALTRAKSKFAGLFWCGNRARLGCLVAYCVLIIGGASVLGRWRFPPKRKAQCFFQEYQYGSETCFYLTAD